MLPYPGSLVEQPFALVWIGMQMSSFARAFAIFDAAEDRAPVAVRNFVVSIQLASMLERTRSTVAV